MLVKGTKRIGTCLTVALVVGSAFCALGQNAPQHSQTHHHKRAEREQIEAMEKQFQQAQLSEDIATMDKLLSDDYLGIGANGELSTKTQQLDHMRNRMMTITKLQLSDQKIKIFGQVAIVTSMANIEGQIDGAPLHGNYRYTRVYQRLPNGSWKITSFEATRRSRPDAEPPAG